MFNIRDELQCYVTCISDSGLLPLIGVVLLAATLMFGLYLKSTDTKNRLISLVLGQLSILAAIALIIHAMNCSQMLSLEIYMAYVILSTSIILLLPRVYYKVLIKRYKARPITEIMDWPQEFVDELDIKATVYYYDSAVPGAFASGKAIFLSIGMLELTDTPELKAILAHEVWHLRHNNKTPILRQLALMSFTGNHSQDELEILADRFAEKTVGKAALESARAKLV
ncbi:M48 family metalloprotease [Methanolobus profundi]|uniref:Heat shock protein HtpX n=1 Tax=Methanolobus profundi TaxID=487685 RepID=A0A1I4UUK8_9EURY|nr:M48 family metalloprotease [Methanolobus profundi]SFM92470.1 heat shock protein HtpX [Methanolobus profundi]